MKSGRKALARARRIIVKIGSNALADHPELIPAIAADVAELTARGVELSDRVERRGGARLAPARLPAAPARDPAAAGLGGRGAEPAHEPLRRGLQRPRAARGAGAAHALGPGQAHQPEQRARLARRAARGRRHPDRERERHRVDRGDPLRATTTSWPRW